MSSAEAVVLVFHKLNDSGPAFRCWNPNVASFRCSPVAILVQVLTRLARLARIAIAARLRLQQIINPVMTIHMRDRCLVVQVPQSFIPYIAMPPTAMRPMYLQIWISRRQFIDMWRSSGYRMDYEMEETWNRLWRCAELWSHGKDVRFAHRHSWWEREPPWRANAPNDSILMWLVVWYPDDHWDNTSV